MYYRWLKCGNDGKIWHLKVHNCSNNCYLSSSCCVRIAGTDSSLCLMYSCADGWNDIASDLWRKFVFVLVAQWMRKTERKREREREGEREREMEREIERQRERKREREKTAVFSILSWSSVVTQNEMWLICPLKIVHSRTRMCLKFRSFSVSKTSGFAPSSAAEIMMEQDCSGLWMFDAFMWKLCFAKEAFLSKSSFMRWIISRKA